MPIGNNTAPPMTKPRMAPSGPPRPNQSYITTSQPTPTMVPKPSEKKSARRSLRASEIIDERGYRACQLVRIADDELALQVRQYLFEFLRS